MRRSVFDSVAEATAYVENTVMGFFRERAKNNPLPVSEEIPPDMSLLERKTFVPLNGYVVVTSDSNIQEVTILYPSGFSVVKPMYLAKEWFNTLFNLPEFSVQDIRKFEGYLNSFKKVLYFPNEKEVRLFVDTVETNEEELVELPIY